MKFFATAITLVPFLLRIASMTINTPTSVVLCQPVLFTWSDGVAPFYLSLIPGGKVSAPALVSFDPLSTNTKTWNVNLPAGTTITAALKDSTGAQAFSDVVTVQPSSDSSCVSASTSSANADDTAPPASSAASSSIEGTLAGTSAAPAVVSSVSHVVDQTTSTTSAPHVASSNSPVVPASTSGSQTPKLNGSSRSSALSYTAAVLAAAVGAVFF
ncbi:hypothetical protein BDQ12DRAFT_680711 [Crucibulum laeve]|uniref:Ser-Thr-rich glycosyl-phosphatidyl-inositol-anchored membrane family-domain-containing protein n=1 Tax=Crucibulum laeve TaxID=68775 RepID=A0A5C3M4T1_9AGAR|nr:hypothetical protein BDQ12DRAFT_680711 [Crucibulum laeve]